MKSERKAKEFLELCYSSPSTNVSARTRPAVALCRKLAPQSRLLTEKDGGGKANKTSRLVVRIRFRCREFRALNNHTLIEKFSYSKDVWNLLGFSEESFELIFFERTFWRHDRLLNYSTSKKPMFELIELVAIVHRQWNPDAGREARTCASCNFSSAHSRTLE